MENLSTKNKSEETASLVDIVLNYLSHWKLFVICILAALIIGSIVVVKTEHEYLVSSSILIKENKGNNPSMAGLEELGLVSTTNNIDNEISVLSSPDLMSQVVQSLELQTSYYTKNIFRRTEIYKDCPYSVRLEDKLIPYFTDQIQLSINTNDSSGIFVEGIYITKEGTEIQFSDQLSSLPASVDLPSELGRLNISKLNLKYKTSEANNHYFIVIKGIEDKAKELVKDLRITSSTKNSSVLEIKMNTSNELKGKDILSELVKKYNEDNVKENNQTAFNTSVFINERLKEIALELGSVEKDVEDYKQSQGITNLSSETQLYVQQTGQNEEKKIDIETQLKIVGLVENFITKPENTRKSIPNLGINDPGLIQAITAYNTQLLDFQRLEASLSTENPTYIRLVDELRNMRTNILNSVVNVKRSMYISKQDINTQSNMMSAKIHSVPMQERGLLEKMRQQQIKENLYLFLLQKREETNITMASTSDKAKVIVIPRSAGRVAPDSKKILLAVLLLGIVVAITIVYVRNLFKVTVANREELERLSDLNVIGQIPINDTDQTVVVKKDETSPMIELFRSLRNSIFFVLDKKKEEKVILVTSTISGEGKTFISLNLAISIALNKKRVLLIGMDVRNPQLANRLNFTQKIGLTSFLSGDVEDWKKLVINNKKYESLDILPAGIIPPNPNELLMNERIEDLMREARESYDFIVLDTAPVGIVSDTFLLSKLSDMTLYIVLEQVTHKKSIEFINDQQVQSRLKNTYLVLNGVHKKNENYRYGYGQTYGYSENKKNTK